MRMPGMDGATLLGLVRQRAPDTVRILLTGAESARAADDDGCFFRVLSKPCAPSVLVSTVKAAMQEYSRLLGE
jgi:DNA-binding NtrC family response regulator